MDIIVNYIYFILYIVYYIIEEKAEFHSAFFHYINETNPTMKFAFKRKNFYIFAHGINCFLINPENNNINCFLTSFSHNILTKNAEKYSKLFISFSLDYHHY